MLRRARNPLVSMVLAIAGALVFVASMSMVSDPGTADDTSEFTETPVAAAPSSGETPDSTAAPTTTTTQPPVVETVEATVTTIAPDDAAVDTAPTPPPPNANVVPTRVRISKIDVDATMIDLHKKADNTLEVPEDIHISGWYTGRSVPGELGPSVVVGHVDSAAQGAGVFYRLRELDVGDLIHIDRSDGSIAEFRVTDYELVLKNEFPTDKVYGSVEGSKLRLITCGGGFNSATGHYLGNLIVYAEHIGTTEMIVSSSWDLAS